VAGLLLVGLTVLVLAFVATVLWQSSGRGMGVQPPCRAWAVAGAGRSARNLYDRLFSGAVTDFLDFYIGGVSLVCVQCGR